MIAPSVGSELPACVHCGRRFGSLRPRSLCAACYKRKDTRSLYPATQRGRRPEICLACGKKANRPRGMCWVCYYTPGLRASFPSAHSRAPDAPEDFTGEAPDAPAPCPWPPGSEGKKECLRERAAGGVSLFHPGDRRAG